METRPPTVGRILIAIGFAVSCFGLFLFLWIAFGGPVPLKAEGYKVTVPFDEASQLAEAADVRISGVSVGRVSRVEGGPDGEAEATLELDARYAPLPEDTQAILRQKTLLGETYVELTPGSAESGSLPEGAHLPAAQVSEAVQLDEVFRTFDPSTRAAFQGWMQGQAAALRGRGDDFSVAIASLEPFADEAERALRLLDTQELAVSRLVRDGGEVFGALVGAPGPAPRPDREREHRVRHHRPAQRGTGGRVHDLPDVPPRVTRDAHPPRGVRDRHESGGHRASPDGARAGADRARAERALTRAARLLPARCPATIDAAPAGMRATRRLLDDNLPPLLGGLDDWLGPVNAILEVVRRYRREVTGLSNLAAASQGVFFDFATLDSVHYLRTMSPLTPEAVAAYPQRLEVTRTNPYIKPGGYLGVRSTIGSFETRQCTAGIDAFLNPASSTDPLFLQRTDGDLAEGQLFFDRINLFAFNDQLGTAAMTPPALQRAGRAAVGRDSPGDERLPPCPRPAESVVCRRQAAKLSLSIRV